MRIRARVDEDHDRKLEALCAMDRQHAHAFRAFFDDRCIRDLAFFSLVIEPLNKRAKARRGLGFESPRHIHRAKDVCERLLPRRPNGDARMRTRFFEQLRNRVGDGPAISFLVQACEERESGSNRA